MKLLVQYYFTRSTGELRIALRDIETTDLIHVIDAEDDTAAGMSLIDAARSWAACFGHEIAGVDAAALGGG